MKKQVLVPLADGFEEIECITIIDILRRCGIEVLLAGIAKTAKVDEKRAYTGAHGVEIIAPRSLELLDAKELDACHAIALPGGGQGMENLRACARLAEILREFSAQGRLVAAICASPIVLDSAGVLRGEFACYPSCEHACSNALNSGAHYNDRASVVVQGSQITGAGPASAAFFALEIARYLLQSSSEPESKADSAIAAMERELLIDKLHAAPIIIRH